MGVFEKKRHWWTGLGLFSSLSGGQLVGLATPSAHSLPPIFVPERLAPSVEQEMEFDGSEEAALQRWVRRRGAFPQRALLAQTLPCPRMS